jgi:hypothetical protein
LTLHELAHVLGLGTSPEWNKYVTPAGFTGPNAEAVNGGQPIPLTPDEAHFAVDVPPSVIGEPVSASEPADLYEDRLTSLDFAALQDIGWSLNPSRFQFTSDEAPVLAQGDATLTVLRLGDTSTPATVHYGWDLDSATVAFSGNVAPITGMINFAPGMASATFMVHIPIAQTVTLIFSGFPAGVLRTVPVLLDDATGGPVLGPLSSAKLLVPTNPTGSSGQPPVVTSAQLVAAGRADNVVVSYSNPMDLGRVRNPGGYSLVIPGHGKKGKAVTLPLIATSYDVATDTVTFRVGRKLTPGQRLELTLRGTGSQAIEDASGESLDGKGDGVAGSDATFVLKVPRPGKKARKPRVCFRQGCLNRSG